MNGCVDCRTNRRELHPDRTGDVVCLRCYLERHADDPVVPDQPRATAGARTSRRAVSVDTLVATLLALQLAPNVVHAKTPTVRCICPACGSPDSQGIWRSLLVDGRSGRLAWICDNGCPHDRVNTAFRQLVDERTSDVA